MTDEIKQEYYEKGMRAVLERWLRHCKDMIAIYDEKEKFAKTNSMSVEEHDNQVKKRAYLCDAEMVQDILNGPSGAYVFDGE
jgi:hypothetical protein